ncbi:EF-hand domain-containing protein [Streptomyces sp. NPDC050560]|uniref:EF-hand domain-containing protein n=1 Tax=Streptomyces sp. NPDC050560 TaxID=3365630 RepID=UPI0037ADD7A6
MGVLLDQKYEKLFSLLDINGDGVIAADDFTLMADRVLEAFDEKGTEKGGRYSAEMDNYWRSLYDTADRNDDGVIDKEEFLGALHQVSSDFDTLIAPLYRTGFRVADRDDDGVVGRTDFITAFAAIGVPGAEAGRTFDGLTGDSGQVTEDQLMTAVAEYYRGDDTGNTSRLLFGAL